MIVKLRFEECKGTKLKVATEEKEVAGYMRMIVDKDTLATAVTTYDANKSVVGFEYEGTDFESDMAFIGSLYPNSLNTPILYYVDLRAQDVSLLTSAYFASLCNLAPKSVRLAFKCPEKYCDMGTVWYISTTYPNTAFCGGLLLRIPGANIGCIRASDIPGRSFGSLKPVVSGCGCVMETVDFDDVEIIFEIGAVKQAKPARVGAKTPKIKTDKPTKPKKTAVSLFSLGGDGLSTF